MPPIFSRDALQSRLPDLLKAPNKTTFSAMQDIHYTGPIAPWTGFKAGVLASMLPSGGNVIDHSLKGRDIKLEQVYVADETGVQGRFQQAVGHVIGAVSEARGVDIRFADFKSAGRQYRKTPDVAIVSRSTPVTLKAVGELKVPWINAHRLDEDNKDLDSLRSTIGQVAEYMIDLKVPYGFHSTYDQTIFLRHTQIQGLWTLEYSYVIDNNDTTDVSVKQCFWYLARLAALGQPVTNHEQKHHLIVER
jgi:hypothetical protein